MKPFYLTSILFISLGTALPVIHRDNNGIVDDLQAIVKDVTGAVEGITGALGLGTPNPPLNGDPAFEEAIFNAVKSVLGIEDPRSSEEIILSLKEAGNKTFDQICQRLDTFRREHKGPAGGAGGAIDSLGVGLTSLIDSMIKLVGLQCPSDAAADRNK